MKKIILPLLYAALGCLALLSLPSCRSDLPPLASTIPISSQPASPSESTAEPVYDPEHYVVIRTAEDLMAFQRAVNEDGYRFDGMTVVFLDDVDMLDYLWSPLDGKMLKDVTFDGMGHTVSNLRFTDYEYPLDAEPDNTDKGCGLVDVAEGNMIFRDLTLLDSTMVAYDHSVGNFVGAIKEGLVIFENCRTVGFTAEGWLNWFQRDRETGGHAVAMWMGGFVGSIGESGRTTFSRCSAEDLTLEGFHNLAGFVGYDVSGRLDASDFSDCNVTGADLTFSYCLAESYTAEQDRKFVSVFFNSHDWTDNIDDCTEAGCHFSDVAFYDWANDCTPYTPDTFRSHPCREEVDTND